MINKINLDTSANYRYYHIVTDLERRFDSLEQALDAYSTHQKIYPRIPGSYFSREDRSKARFCVSTSLEGCIMGLGVTSVFRRCLAANDFTQLYTIDNREVYPVIILTFEFGIPLYRPTSDEVPDVEDTDEHWITSETIPSKVELRWLDSNSIILREEKSNSGIYDLVCESVRFAIPNSQSIHPWLTGTGQPLDCDDEEYQNGDLPWPAVHEIELALNGVIPSITSSARVTLRCENYHTFLHFVLFYEDPDQKECDILAVQIEDCVIKIDAIHPSVSSDLISKCATIVLKYGFILDTSALVNNTL